MTTLCTTPGCFWFGRYCREHSQDRKAETKPAVVKPIPKFSEKRAKEERSYKKEVKEELKEGVTCEIQSPVCTGMAEGKHHIVKRSLKNLRDKKNQLNACNACNQWAEQFPKEAIKLNVVKSKFSEPPNRA